MKIQIISKNVGYALLVSALFMFLSILVSVSRGNDSALAALTISFIITFVVGVFPFIFVRKHSAISTQEGYMIIVLSWLLSFLFGMLPYALWGGPFTIVNAWFESVSGYTTTGSTILEDVESLPDSLLFWRASTHFIGGLGVVVFLLLVIPGSTQMKLRLSNMERSSLSKYEYRSRTNKTVNIFAWVYFGITAAAFLCYLLAGMGPFDAICHAMSVVSTGGFSTRNLSIGAFDSVAVDLITMFFMICGSVHFGILFMCFVMRSVRPLKNEIFRCFMIMIAIASLIVTVSLKVNGVEQTWGRSLLSASFHVVSFVTTTGFAISDNSVWPMLPSAMLMFVGLICGMAGSTCGGIKIDRFVLLVKSIVNHMKNVLHPTSVNEVRVNGRIIREQDLSPHIMYISMYIFAMLFSVAAGMMVNGNGIHALYGTLSSISNIGASLYDLGTFSNYASEPAAAKILYTINMFLGRVEIYPVLAVLMMVTGRRLNRNR